ncbi:MAG: hypothetical protein AAFQ79_08690 [Pseudomonadota bacterium]
MSHLFPLIFLACLSALAMGLYARRHNWRRSLVTYALIVLCLPLVALVTTLGLSTMLGRPAAISAGFLAEFMTTFAPWFLSWLCAPMFGGLVLGRLSERSREAKGQPA